MAENEKEQQPSDLEERPRSRRERRTDGLIGLLITMVALTMLLGLLQKWLPLSPKPDQRSTNERISRLEAKVDLQAEQIRNLEARMASDHALMSTLAENQKAQGAVLQSVIRQESPQKP